MTFSAETRQVSAFFLISFFFSWAFWTPGVLSHFGVSHARLSSADPLQLLGDLGPAVGALVVAAWNRGDIRHLGSSLWRAKSPPRWYAASIFIPVIIISVSSAARAATLHLNFCISTERIWHPGGLQSRLLSGFVGSAALAIGMFIFAAAEEIGWRGFALPRLISSIGFLPATLFLGVMWALWHLPLAFTDGNPLRGESFFLFAVSTALLSLLVGYIWVRTTSVLLAALFHTAGNVSFFLLEPTATTGYRSVIALIFVLGMAYACRRQAPGQSLAGKEAERVASTAGSSPG